MNRSFGICNLSVVPMRAQPSDKAEQLAQLLFGDHFELLEIQDKWVRVLNWFDDYEGWIDRKQYAEISFEHFVKLHDVRTISGSNILQTLEKKSNGELINILPGSFVPLFDEGSFSINEETYTFSGGLVKPDITQFRSDIEGVARFFLNAPYLWGGNSPFGIDCSGLTQVTFKFFGIKLKRDSSMQAEQGQTVDFLTEAKAGDLAFFDNDEGRIVHVGIMLNNTTIIHASGRVKIDTIDDRGIFSSDLQKHSHKLRIIKRFV